MDYQSFRNLEWIEGNLTQRGKYAQIAVAAALQRAGAGVSDIQLVEGFDLKVRYEGRDYGLEVKTTTGDRISLQQKDLDDVRKVRSEGLEPGFSVLRLTAGAQWWISRPEPIEVEKERSGAKTLTMRPTAFRAAPLAELQKAVRQHFDDVLDEAVRHMKKRGFASDANLGLSDLKTALDLDV